jgi:AraC-like DNA-binding protein
LTPVDDTQERIAVLTDYLMSKLTPSEPAALPLLKGIPLFHDTSSSPVKAIAAGTLLSERTVQLRFKKYVGYSPKELLRFLRFKQVLQALMLSRSDEADWFEIIDRFGYHDQSHLNKDFKHYTGMPPRQFLKLNASGDFCINRS